MLLSRGPRRGREDGAAAVEFALVSVVLFPLMFGIIDFGLWFNDSLAMRQGVRDAARTGVVQTTTSCSTSAAGIQRIACDAARQSRPVTGNAWSRVVVPSGWAKGQPLIVCTVVKSTGTTGITPLPNGGVMRSKTQMSIEVDDPLAGGTTAAGSAAAVWPTTTAPTTWSSWCT